MRTHTSPYATASTPMTLAETANLPTTLDISTTARLLGIGRTTLYTLVAQDAMPVPVIRAGQTIRVPTAPLLALLGITTTPQTAEVTSSTAGDPAPVAWPVPTHAPTLQPYTP